MPTSAPSKKGFLLPSIVDPESDICIAVHIPNEPQYLRAFWGVYERLGYWFSWERDDAHTGKDAAARWRASVARTRDTYNEFGDLCEMNINIQCGCCASSPPVWPTFNLEVNVHIGQQTIDEILSLPGGNMDNGVDPPGQAWGTYNGYLVDKCAYATQVATDIYNSWENLSSLSFALAGVSFASLMGIVGTAAFTEAIVGVVGGIVGSLASWPIVVASFLAFAGLAGSSFYNYFEALQDKITIAELACCMYGATSSENARSRLIEQFEDWGVEAGLDVAMSNGAVLQTLLTFARVLMPLELMEPLFDNTDYAIALPPASCLPCLGVGGPETLLAKIEDYFELEEATGTRFNTEPGRPNLVNTSGTPSNQAAISGLGLYTQAANQDTIWSAFTDVWIGGNNPYSVSVWARSDVVVPPATQGQHVFIIGDNSGNWTSIPANLRFQHGDGVSNNVMQAHMGTNNVSTAVTKTHSLYIPVGEWVFCVMAHEPAGDLWMISVNGGEYQTITTGGLYPTFTGNRLLAVGSSWVNGGGGSRMTGCVDELVLYNDVLTPSEIAWIYNSGFGRSRAEYDVV